MKSSLYNFWVPLLDGGALYNAATGAAIQLKGAGAEWLKGELTSAPKSVDLNLIGAEFLSRLEAYGFVVPDDHDELSEIRKHYWNGRDTTPICLTVTVTQDCNLGCYYCYESRTGDRLESQDLDILNRWVRATLERSPGAPLHVDWYGGEPMLNVAFIEASSLALQQTCLDVGSHYAASIISNGTNWPADPMAFAQKHKLRQIQISFDGLQRNHDRRRRYRDKGAEGVRSSFVEAQNVVDALCGEVRVDVRLNIDRGNLDDVKPFVEMAIARHWFSGTRPAVLQLARISSYASRVSFIQRSQLSEDEFESVRETVRRLIPGESWIDETTSRATYPAPRRSVCAALANRSIVFGADGSHYRCGLQVGEKDRAVMVKEPSGTLREGTDATWWQKFDPTIQPNCSRCSFLPVCWGGCPKKHLEGDAHALDEQSLYWRRMLPKRIAWQLKSKLFDENYVFAEADQFRV